MKLEDSVTEVNPVVECKDSKYVKLRRVEYIQAGKRLLWDYVQVHDSVAVLIYHKTERCFILVKQFRPAVYMHNTETKGITYELCAGIIDKTKSEEEIAIEEVEEECGYKVDHIARVTSYYGNTGFSATKQTLFYAEVDESMKVSEGGGVDTELIELFRLPVDQAKQFMMDESKPKPAPMFFAIEWWFLNKQQSSPQPQPQPQQQQQQQQ